MRLTGDRLHLGQEKGRSNPWRMLVYLLLIVGGISLVRLVDVGRVQPLFQATPTPTRITSSFMEEADAHFSAGNLNGAIGALQSAVSIDPNNADLWSELARVQTYSSDLQTTLDDRRSLLAQARDSIEQAIRVDPDNARTHAIRALVYDWSAAAEIKDNIGIGDQVRVEATIEEGGRILGRRIELPGSVPSPDLSQANGEQATVNFTGVVEEIRQGEWVVSGRTIMITERTVIQEKNRREAFLAEADTSATRALQLAPGDPYALAFHAEVLVDQQSFAQAMDLAQEAASNDALVPLQDRLDIYRVYGTVLESNGRYLSAIEAYQKAVEINPNLTFLYLRIGANYRRLRDVDAALAAFDKAARINQQLGFEDPTPYLAIGRTYVQEGQFFIAAVNIEAALRIDPTNADIYARLGSVYFQARNYESAIPIFACALDGCSTEENREILCKLEIYRCADGGGESDNVGWEVFGLELNSSTVEYYYTYGSVLAAFAGTEEFPDACVDAERVFKQLMTEYGTDAIVKTIVAEGRAICASPGPPEPPLTPTEISTDSS
ncbi:MAG: tetratricopeptide repeat protein [Anaerolineales bacterium]|nr:tetratricopeptide repeat protein [Anaerolineales bacterium]